MKKSNEIKEFSVPIYLGLALLVLLSSCAGLTSMEIPFEKPSLVINSYFTADENWQVTLSQSHHVLDIGSPAYVNTGTVFITGSDGSYIPFTFVKDGVYTNDSLLPKANVDYTVNASAPDYESVSATDYAPSKPEITDVKLDYFNSTINIPAEYKLSFTLKDKAGEDNYYMFMIANSNSFFDSTEFEYFYLPTFISTDPIMEYEVKYSFSDFLEGQEANYVERVFFSDELFDGSDRTFTFYPTNVVDEKIYFYLLSVSKTYYLYEISSYKQIDAKSNIMAEPVKVYNNVDGGMGIFAGYSTVLDSVDVP